MLSNAQGDNAWPIATYTYLLPRPPFPLRCVRVCRLSESAVAPTTFPIPQLGLIGGPAANAEVHSQARWHVPGGGRNGEVLGNPLFLFSPPPLRHRGKPAQEHVYLFELFSRFHFGGHYVCMQHFYPGCVSGFHAVRPLEVTCPWIPCRPSDKEAGCTWYWFWTSDLAASIVKYNEFTPLPDIAQCPSLSFSWFVSTPSQRLPFLSSLPAWTPHFFDVCIFLKFEQILEPAVLFF